MSKILPELRFLPEDSQAINFESKTIEPGESVPEGFKPFPGSKWVLNKRLPVQWEVKEVVGDQVLLQQVEGFLKPARGASQLLGGMDPDIAPSRRVKQPNQMPIVRRWVKISELIAPKLK